MKKKTKVLFLIIMIAGVCFSGLIVVMHLVARRYDNRLLELVEQVKTGMPITEVEKILPFEYKVYTEQDDLREWADQEVTKYPLSDEMIDPFHLYVFFCSSEYHYYSADCILVYIDPKTQTVKHVALQYW